MGLIEDVHGFYYQHEAKEPIVFIIQDSKDISSVEYSDQVLKALSYTEFIYKTIDLSQESSFQIPANTKLIINTTESITSLNPKEIEELVKFTAVGGNLIFLGTITEDGFAYLQGIKPVVDFSYTTGIRGFKAVENIFPGFKGKSLYSPRSVPHDGIIADDFSQKTRVLATAFTDETYPVILENQIGFGSVIVFNTGILFEKQYRGIVFSVILKLLPNMPYRTANVGTMFLDDFPSPLYNVKLEPIASEYDVEQAEFVTNIWWPDMKAYADTVLMTYSAMTAFNYNANVVPPFDYHEWELARLRIRGKEIKPSIFLAQDIIKTRHELAFHGYNHFSLTNSEWNNNQRFMISALNSVQKRWKIDDLGTLPITYVPPTNYIDSTGVQAITKGLPSIKILSSLYLGEVVDGGGREFGIDPYNSKLFNYPRITSGFSMNENSLFDQHGMQLLTGVWNHFVHPDDVFQIVQRDADAFESRNPDSLGWKTTNGRNEGLYHLFKKRIRYTKNQYPFIRLVSAQHGTDLVKDWLNASTTYSEEGEKLVVNVTPPKKYEATIAIKDEKYWFMYVPSVDKEQMEIFLKDNVEGYSFSKYWDGYLFQFYSKKNRLEFPKSNMSKYSNSSLDRILVSALNDLNSFQLEIENPTEDLVPELTATQILQKSINRYIRNPKNIEAQEELIALSIENDQNVRAIQVLEYRLKSSPNWKPNDLARLVTYYGYESALKRAESFLEELWRKYEDEKVILFKNQLVENLGLYSPEFVTRWRLREIEIYGAGVERTLAYTISIESQETWPEVKQRLRNLIKDNPRNDSLYAYTIERSFFYESSDSTIALLEEFPKWSHNQLNSFATQFANIYGYEVLNYEKALYWAERSDDILRRSKLEWIAQMNELDRFYVNAKEYLNETPNDDSLRAFAGTSLYYLGFKDRGYEIMYPLFDNGKSRNTDAHSLIQEEFKFITYNDKKELYSVYPNFFSEIERTKFRNELRWNEGVRVSMFGEYFTDNFDNQSARGGVSVQFGNRLNRSHLFKLEDVFVNDVEAGQSFYSNFTGIGYEFEKRKEDFSRVFRFGPSVFYGSEGVLGEAFVSYSISYDSTFTALNLSFEPEYTREAILQDIYKVKGEIYREDPWFRNKFLTTLSGNTQFYTNNVIDYSITGRAYVQPWSTPFRGRLIGELGWQDASKNFPNANPFFTQNNYFLQGVGFDMRYRHPNTFDYNSLFELEIMGKNDATDGYFMTGRINLEHKFKNYWQVKLGTEFSTSSVYQSNRIFFTISHFFRKKIKHPKQR